MIEFGGGGKGAGLIELKAEWKVGLELKELGRVVGEWNCWFNR
jgi:hypothetical protein